LQVSGRIGHEFAVPQAAAMDFVLTVCDQAAGEACPVWPGRPISAHWALEDPAAAKGDEEDRRRAFFEAFSALQTRLLIFVSLPIGKLDPHLLQRRLDEIGKLSAEGESATGLSDRIRAASRPIRLSPRRRAAASFPT